MSVHPVNWHEGMFLRPHHFQAAQRHTELLVQLNSKWDNHYNWGIQHIKIDTEALGNYKFSVTELCARLRDGTLIRIPEDGMIAEIDLRDRLLEQAQVFISLAVPKVLIGQANLTRERPNPEEHLVRYYVDKIDVADENTGDNKRTIEVRKPIFRFVMRDEQEGYELLRIACVQRAALEEGKPELRQEYIPPVLCCDAWKSLSDNILREISDRIGRNIKTLAPRMRSRGITFDSRGQGDVRMLEYLRVMNEAYGILQIMSRAKGIHPLTAYMELARICGQLAIFRPNNEMPDLPLYDHDDLGTIFYKVKQYIEEAYAVDVAPIYKEVPFIGRQLRMQVDNLMPQWLQTSAWMMFVGVKSDLTDYECVNLLTREGKNGLQMKIGSVDRVDQIFLEGAAGLRFTHATNPPTALPKISKLVYLQIDSARSVHEWANVERTLSIGIRLNENLIVGDIQGKQRLSIRTADGRTTPMEFTLFLVPFAGQGSDAESSSYPAAPPPQSTFGTRPPLAGTPMPPTPAPGRAPLAPGGGGHPTHRTSTGKPPLAGG